MNENLSNENDDTEIEESSDYVTRDELSALLDEKLTALVNKFTGDSLPETETTDELDEVVGRMSPADIEAMFERGMAKALKTLQGRQAAKPAPKKATAKKAEPAVEPTPEVPGKKSLSERLWGTK